MARYDRIAPLPLPQRDRAPAGFDALRDLAERERDADLARRLRLHFLALRPLLRRVRADETLDMNSLALQVDRVREELGTLSTRDPQRTALGELLSALADPSPVVAAEAALQLADRALVWDHISAADAFAGAAADLASAHAAPSLEARALCVRARCASESGDAEAAARHAGRAAVVADAAGDHAGWAAALATQAAHLYQAGQHTGALDRLVQIRERGRAVHEPLVTAIAEETAARLNLTHGQAEAAAEHAWQALVTAPPLERRVRLVELLGDALSALGHRDAADHAYRLAAAAADGPERLRLTARRARSRAEQGDADGYRTLSRSVPGVTMSAATRIELARGAMALGDLDTARRHATAAQQSARALLQRQTARVAAALAADIEAGDGHIMAVRVNTGPAAAAAASIAAHVLSVGSLDAQG